MYIVTFYYPFSDKVFERDIDSALYLDVLSLNPGHQDCIFMVLLSPTGKMTEQNLNSKHDHFTPFWYISYKSSYHVIIHSIWATDSNTEEIHKHYIDRYTKQEQQQNQEAGNV
jgi:hypothetical protein